MTGLIKGTVSFTVFSIGFILLGFKGTTFWATGLLGITAGGGNAAGLATTFCGIGNGGIGSGGLICGGRARLICTLGKGLAGTMMSSVN
jgi:hypothetical protein